MYRLFGLVLAGSIVLGFGTNANAQFSLSIGTPYYNTGYAYPYGGAFGPAAYGVYSAPAYGVTTYSSGYSGYVAPGTTTFYSGTYGLYPTTGFYSPSYYSYSTYRPGGVWMGVPRASSVWMGGIGGWRGGRYWRW